MPTIDSNLYQDLGLSQPAQVKNPQGELGQEAFLELMTTQLRNQDPFEPMDNGEFLGQLASFGTVSGIEDLKTEIQKLAGSLTSNQTLQAAGMVGHEVLIPATHAQLSSGGSIRAAVELPNSVSNLNVGIYDSSGQLIRNVSLGSQSSGTVTFNWDGLATDGGAVPPGRYEIRAEAVTAGINEAYDVLIADTVQSVTLPRAGEEMKLDLATLGEVSFSQIRQIR